jgi:hypothetical protein
MAQGGGMQIKSYAKRSGTKKPTYTLAQFDGRWQEISRTNIESKAAVEITDTMYLRFYDTDKTKTKEGSSLEITGSAEIYKNDNLTTSAADFKIVSVDKNEMTLNDNMGNLRKFVKTDLFAYERAAAPPPGPLAAEKYTIDLAFLKTNWYAYRRGANPGFVKSETPLIKKLNLIEKVSDNNYKGKVEYSRYGKAIVEDCTLMIGENNMLTLTSAGNTWNMELYKCDAKELVAGKKGEIVYYFNNDN